MAELIHQDLAFPLLGPLWLDNHAVLLDADAELAMSLDHTVVVRDGAPEILLGLHLQFTVYD